MLILADKHGGRNRYHEFLPTVFGDRFIRCHKESTESSRYRVGNAEIRFETNSERHLPVALASMACNIPAGAVDAAFSTVSGPTASRG